MLHLHISWLTAETKIFQPSHQGVKLTGGRSVPEPVPGHLLASEVTQPELPPTLVQEDAGGPPQLPLHLHAGVRAGRSDCPPYLDGAGIAVAGIDELEPVVPGVHHQAGALVVHSQAGGSLNLDSDERLGTTTGRECHQVHPILETH